MVWAIADIGAHKIFKQPIAQLKASGLNRVKASPTLDDYNFLEGTDEGRFFLGEATEVSRPLVPPSESQWLKFNKVLSDYFAWIAMLPIVFGAVATVIYFFYDLRYLKDDHSLLKTKVESSEEKIINIEKNQLEHGKEITFINKNISALESSINQNSSTLKDILVEQIKTTTKLESPAKSFKIPELKDNKVLTNGGSRQ